MLPEQPEVPGLDVKPVKAQKSDTVNALPGTVGDSDEGDIDEDEDSSDPEPEEVEVCSQSISCRTDRDTRQNPDLQPDFPHT